MCPGREVTGDAGVAPTGVAWAVRRQASLVRLVAGITGGGNG